MMPKPLPSPAPTPTPGPRILSEAEMEAHQNSSKSRKIKEQLADDFLQTSATEAAGSGGLQGVSLGLAKPVLSGIASVTENIPYKEASKLYDQYQGQLEKEHPAAYGIPKVAGEIGANVALTAAGAPALRGLSKIKGLSNVGKVSPLLTNVMASGAQGLIQEGANQSGNPDENAAEEILNALANGLAFGLAGEAVSAGGKLAAKGGKRLIASMSGLSKGTVDEYAKNSARINGIIRDKMNSFVPVFAENLDSKISKWVGSQEEELQKIVGDISGPIDISHILKTAENSFNKISRLGLTGTRKKAANDIFNTIKEFDQLARQGKEFSASDILDMKRMFQDEATAFYEMGTAGGPAARAFADIAEAAAGTLKDLSPEAGDILDSMSRGILAQRKLGIPLKRDPATFVNKVKNLLSTLNNPDKQQKGMIEAAQELDEIFGTNLSESSRIFKAAVELGKDDVLSGFNTGRSKLVPGIMGALGGAAGEAFNLPGGGATGLSAGAALGLGLQSPMMSRPLITGTEKAKALSGILRKILPGTQRSTFEATRENLRSR